MQYISQLEQAEQLLKHGDFNAALAIYDSIIAADPKCADAFLGKAQTLASSQRPKDAIVAYSQFLALRPTSVPALLARAQARFNISDEERAFEDFDLAAALDPDAKYASGMAPHLAMKICRWLDFDISVAELAARVEAGDPVVLPVPFMMMSASPQLHRKCAEIFARDRIEARTPARPVTTPAKKIRLGYFSMDFCEHAVSHLCGGLLRGHDRERFEVTAFTLADNPFDSMRKQIAAHVDHFVNAEKLTVTEVAARSREMGIDIAIDMNVHLWQQPAIFSHGAAPIQVNYLGYPGTAGADTHDYIIGDRIITPLEHADHFSERIVRFPHAYQPTDFHRFEPLRTPARQDVGLPATGFVFCCFNDSQKITPDVFDIWMRLLKEVDGSVLWLLSCSDAAARNLRAEAETRGVAADRLIFAPRMSFYDHLSRHRAADLFLDTFNYNAHTTASDALWAGLPLLTMIGETFPSRVAASLVTAAGIPELITHSPAEYEQRAHELALNPEALASVKKRLVDSRMKCPLFDTVRYTRNLEQAYERMMERYRAGLPPDHITVVEP